MLNLYSLVYADDTVRISESAAGLLAPEYSIQWNTTISVQGYSELI